MDKRRRKSLEIDRHASIMFQISFLLNSVGDPCKFVFVLFVVITNKQERVRKLFPVWSKNVPSAGMKGKISGIKFLWWLMERTEISKEKCQKEIPILPLVVNQVNNYMSSTSRRTKKNYLLIMYLSSDRENPHTLE